MGIAVPTLLGFALSRPIASADRRVDSVLLQSRLRLGFHHVVAVFATFNVLKFVVDILGKRAIFADPDQTGSGVFVPEVRLA